MHNLSIIQRVLAFSKLIIFLFLLVSVSNTYAQTSSAKNKSPFPVKYTSLADQNILLRTITLAPVYDNLNGIYAKPIQKLLVELLQNDKAWGYAEIVGHDQNKFIENYDLNSNDVIDVLAQTKAHGLLTAFITKGPRGINAKLKLFSHSDGLILAEESVEDFNTFEIAKLRLQFAQMYQNLKNKLPYRGYVLSRRGLEVTVSLGSVNGVKEGQELTLAQIIKLNRHPKLKTLVGVEKEIIAKIVVKKAEPYLSFAQIVFEKETGVVDLGAKVLPLENIIYPTPELNIDGTVVGDFNVTTNNSRPPQPQQITNELSSNNSSEPVDTQIIEKSRILKEQKNELLDRHNSTGLIVAQGTITQYSESNSLVTSEEVISKQSLAPGFLIGARYNIYNEFFVEGSLQSTSFSVNNGLSGSTPYNLSVNFTRTNAFVGFDYISPIDEADEDEIKFTGLLGITNYNTNIDDSTPTSLTSTSVNSLALELRAAMVASADMPLVIGGKFSLAFSPKLSESPVSSGSASTSITSFGFFGTYKLNDKYNFRADITLTNINNRFSGTATRTNPAGSGKIETTTEQFGIEYLF